MIFAAVGSSQTPFDRLVRAVDDLASRIDEEVIIQKGATPYQPQHAQFFDYCEPKRMQSLIHEASVLIAHAGFGIVGDGIRYQKRMILIPREHRFGDAEGNQVELAEHLAAQAIGIFCLKEVSQLYSTWMNIKKVNPCYQFKNSIQQLVLEFIDQKFSPRQISPRSIFP
ncbi:MAG: hypothetical protein ONB16_02375 [candidate division KSB1 bacterium]|nr:hypothetical protein [candidate division KSB1 bacterium]MDZ7319504.1 hypothetical protein [candidate division KSB1 bacterium]MDZ7342473.1 hypothetical protein [candidate division KSB1 bacterium]